MDAKTAKLLRELKALPAHVRSLKLKEYRALMRTKKRSGFMSTEKRKRKRSRRKRSR